MANGNLYMAHRCGFTMRVLTGTLQAAGFEIVVPIQRAHPAYDLCVVAAKPPMTEQQILAIAAVHFPS